jgi:hypothetical protein
MVVVSSFCKRVIDCYNSESTMYTNPRSRAEEEYYLPKKRDMLVVRHRLKRDQPLEGEMQAL